MWKVRGDPSDIQAVPSYRNRAGASRQANWRDWPASRVHRCLPLHQ